MTNRSIRAAGLGGCAAVAAGSMLACLGAASAEAQSVTADSTNAGLDEIVVTAERHSESVQNAPIAIAVVSASELATRGITNGAQMADLVPGLKILTQGPITSLYIRGIGDSNSTPFADPDVTFNSDGVAMSQPNGPSTGFYDLERVEVLKGPQGTLYGRNATSGAVNIITRDPTTELEGSGEITTGNYALLQTTGTINLPIDNTLQIRGAFQSIRHDGYLTDGKNDQDDTAGRIKVLWTPTDDLKVKLTTDYAHQGGKGPGSVPLTTAGQYIVPGNNPWATQTTYANNGGAPPFAAYANQIAGGNVLIDNPNAYLNNSNFGIAGLVEWNVGFATLTVLPAYRNMVQDWDASDFGFGFRQYVNDKTTSVEARLGSNDAQASVLKWVGGLFYLNDSLPNYYIVQQSFVPEGSSFPEGVQTTTTPSDHVQSRAAFGQATLSVVPWLRLTGGLRYTQDSKSEHGSTLDFLPTLADPTATGSYNTDYSVYSNRITWKAGVEADVAEHSMVYANAATGYKVGGFGSAPNPSSLIPTPTLATYRPEEILAYDIGTKNEFLDRRLRLNAEVFYWIYRDQQINSIAIVPVTSTINGLVAGAENAGRGIDKGVDLDVAYRITVDDTITVSTEYLDTKYTTFKYAFLFFSDDDTGKPFNNAPRWSGNITYDHVWHMPADHGNVTASVNSHLTSGYWVDYSYISGAQMQKNYTKTSIDLAYASPGDKWYARLWVRNLENVAVKSYAGTSIPGGPNGPDGNSIQWADLEPPRTYGVTLGARF